MSEADVQKQIIELLLLYNFLIIRINQGRKRNIAFARWYVDDRSYTSGISDVLAQSPDGVLWAIESKAEGKVATEIQKEFLGEVSDRGGIALVADDVETVAHWVEQLAHGNINKG